MTKSGWLKLLVVAGLSVGAAWAYDGVVKTSYTATTDTTRTISTKPVWLMGVTIGTGVSGGQLTIYNSSNTTTTDPRFLLDAATSYTHVLGAYFPIGLSYSTTGTSAAPKITLQYR